MLLTCSHDVVFTIPLCSASELNAVLLHYATVITLLRSLIKTTLRFFFWISHYRQKAKFYTKPNSSVMRTNDVTHPLKYYLHLQRQG